MRNICLVGTLVASILFLASCKDNSQRYLLPELAVDRKLTTAAKTVEVAKLDLPAYVTDLKISIRDTNGVMRPVRNSFWADTPDRALTELLASNLDQALSADVAVDPIPFTDPANVRVDVRVLQFVGLPGKSMQFSGQYFLTSPSGGSLEKVERFDISVPIASSSVEDYAAAQSLAVRTLAQEIAQDISRVRRSQL